MSTPILDEEKDPLGVMLWDYFCGDSDAFLNVWSDTMEMSPMRGRLMFRDYSEMDELERAALAACRGRVLDVGGGSGCHSLVLQERGLDVEAIDISFGCVRLMCARGVTSVHHCDLFDPALSGYDTVLMLMNGAGICGSLDGLNLFLQNLDRLLVDSGQLLLDSTDLTHHCEDDDFPETEDYCGETQFVMIYKGIRSDPFNWLYIDFGLLQTMAVFHGLHCEKICDADNGRYLARITV